MNPDGLSIEHTPLEHSNGRNVAQTFMHNHARPSTAQEADLTQLFRSLNYLIERFEQPQ